MKDKINRDGHFSELKKGKAGGILRQTAKVVLPDFEFLGYKTGCYSFQRQRRINNWTVYEGLQINFSIKEKSVDCSIASRLNPDLVGTNPYNTGLINPHMSLKGLTQDSGALKVQDAYYWHNGQTDQVTDVVKQIFLDYKNYGLPFLEDQFEKLKSHRLIACGLAYIDNLQVDKNRLKIEIGEELKRAGHLVSGLRHPIYIDLKEQLQAIAGQTRDDRKNIPRTAYELLELYWSLK